MPNSTPSIPYLQLCYDILCPPFQYEPKLDVLNAAQSGAMIPNLVTHEWRYMLEQLKAVGTVCVCVCVCVCGDT